MSESLSPTRALLNVVVLAFLAGVLVAIWLSYSHDALSYYATALAKRGMLPAHRILRPSGTTGHLLGILGTLLLISTFAYVARRRMKRLAKAGSPAHWLEVHIFCGIFGPVLVTFHTSFKFNGIVSVAYWSMAVVVASGFVGRYLYVRIPKTIRGEELSQSELEQQAAELRARLAETRLPQRLIAAIDEEERILLAAASTKRSLFTRMRDALAARRRASSLRREIRASGLERHLLHDALSLAHERAELLRRITRLKRTRQLFQLWHVFHRPLVYVMFAILLVHLGVAFYFGYVPFTR